MNKISVAIADTQRLFAESLAGALNLEGDVEVRDHHATTGLGAVDVFVRLSPDILMVDYWLGEMNGVAATRQIRQRHADARVIILAWLCGPFQVQEARVSGAAAFVPKSVALDELIAIVRGVHDGFSVFPASSATSALEWNQSMPEPRGARSLGLSPREIEVLQLSCEGKRTHEVAAQLSIGEGTVKNHVHNILTKTGARSLSEAVARARAQGLVRESGYLRQRHHE